MSRRSDYKLPVMRFLVLFGAMLALGLGLAALSPPVEPAPTDLASAPPAK